MGNEKLHIELLGTFRLRYNGTLITGVNKTRIQELLAYLLLHRDKPQSRRYLSFQFWPESTEKQARTNLRNVLHQLRKTLPEHNKYILADNKTLQWNTSAVYRLDTAEFEQAVKVAGEAGEQENVYEQISALNRAASWYKDDLLLTCYRKWIEPERKRLKEEYIHVLQMLVQMLEENRAYKRAIPYAQKLIEHDTFNEEAYRGLMKLYSLAKDRTRALKTYQKCAGLLQEELDIEPSGETKDLYERLSSDQEEEDKALPYIRGSEEKWSFVGRHQEWDALLKNWKQVLSGDARFVLLSGEPGIGKSRMGYEFKKYLDRQGYQVVYTRSYISAETLSYGLVADSLREESIYRELKELDRVWLQELVRILPELKADHPGLPDAEPVDESRQKNHFLRAISEAFLHNHKPKLLFLDDLQWCDPESIEWLNFLLHYSKTSDMLVIGAIRPVEAKRNLPLQNFISAIRQEGRMAEIILDSLTKNETKELTAEVSGQKVDEGVANYILSETEGNPLFIVEYMREKQFRKLADESAKELPVEDESDFSTLPDRVGAVISARFQYLSDRAWELMGLAASIGREFSTEILAEAASGKEEKVIEGLDELLYHQIIREQKTAIYDFSHDKLREIAYTQLSEMRRRWNHRRIAEAFEKTRIEGSKTHSSLLAFHYEKAGEYKKSISFYKEAAREAHDMLSNQDVTFYKKALKLLKELPAGEQRDRKEQGLLMKLGISLTHFKGFGIEDIVRTCERLKHLSDQLNEQHSVPVLFTLAFGKIVSGHSAEAKQLANEIDAIVNRLDDDKLFVESNYLLSLINFIRGRVSESKSYIREGLSYYKCSQSTFHSEYTGLEMGVMLHGGLSVILLLQDNIPESDEALHEAYAIARDLNHSFSTFHLKYFNTMIWQVKGNVIETHKSAEQFILSDSERRFTYWHYYCEVFFGWAHARQENYKEGLKWIRKGIDGLGEQGIIWNLGYCYSLYAEALAAQGNLQEALSTIEEAFRLLDITREGWYKANAYYIKGKILTKKNPENLKKAKTVFNKAIEIARQQGARLFEDRARACLEQLE